MNFLLIFCNLFFTLIIFAPKTFLPRTSKDYFLKNPLVDNKKIISTINLNDVSPQLLNIKFEIQAENVLLRDKFISNNKENPIYLKQNAVENHFYSFEEKNKKQKQIYRLGWEFLLIIIFILTTLLIININEKLKKEINFIKDEKIILENKKNTLEQEILFQKEKIKDLHQKLNLKIETEKVFFEDLKKIKRSNCTKSQDEILKDLFIKANNSMNIDKRGKNLTFEYNIENQQFLKKLKTLYPTLTNRELKLCIYFRMNLSSKEISILENTTTGTVRVYKTRIKNKIGLNKENRLSCYLLKIE